MLTRRIHSIILLLALLIGAAGMNYVQAAVYSGSCGTSATWSLNTSTGRLTISGTGAMTNWAISNNRPPWYDSYREQITSVVINSGVTTIGQTAFCGCTNLTSVTIPNTVVTIYDYAFEEDAKLTSITIPNSVTYIGYYAFWLCSGLRTVTMSNKVKTIQGAAFNGCSSLKSITLPNTVTTLGIGVFRNCTGLTFVNIPTGLTALPRFTFAGCSALTSIVIPANIKSIGGEAFSGCSALTSVTLPNTLTTMETDVFLNCTSLTSVNIPTGLTILPVRTFQGCSSLATISIPANIQTIGTDVIKNCNALRDVYVYWTTASAIPDGNNMRPKYTTTLHVPCGTTSIYDEKVGWGSYTIVGNTQYTITGKTTDANGTVSIDGGTAGTNVSKTTTCDSEVMLTATPGSDCRYAFIKWTDGVTTNPRTVTVSGNATYTAQFGIATPQGNCGANGNNLTWSLNRCTGVLTISGSGAMKDYERTGENCAEYSCNTPWIVYKGDITSIVLPVGLTRIGNYAFYQCRGVTDIDLPAALLSIGNYAFAETGLQQVCIPEGVTTIGGSAFAAMCGTTAGTTPLKRVYLPNSLTSVGAYALYYNPLKYLTYPTSANSFSTPYRGAYPANEVYASWKTDVPYRQGRVEAIGSPKRKMHIPYGTTALYQAKDWARIYQLVEDVDERAIDLGLSIRWASCNIGATAPEENGNFYAWGDTITRSSFTWANYPYSGTSTNTMTKYCTRAANGTVDNRSTLIAFDDAAYINWGETWRMPTWTEWNELITRCTWKETTINNVSVWQVTGPNGNSIYLPKVGYKNSTSVTAGCYYWSSTLNTANSNDQCNRALYINAANRSGAMYGLRYVGMPVRAVYRREWPSFTLTITDTPDGTSYTKAINAGSTYTLTAQEDACRPFVRWSDGNTENPRTVTVTEDATYTAEYEDTSLASGTCGANVTWKLCDGTLYISGTGAMSNYPAINMPWKSHRASITSVVISDGVTSIGYNAFNGCSNLTSVTIPPSVTSIEQNAFYGCYAMESLYITDLAAWCNVEFGVSVEATPFMRNNYNSGSTEYLGGGNLYLNGTLVTTLTIPDGITEIKNLTFLGCSSITSIDFNQVTTIGSASFKGCHGLTSVTLPEGVTSLKNAFPYCTQLQSISIPASLTSLTTQTLYHSDALTDIYVYWTDNIPGWPGYFTAQSPQPSITLHVPCGTEELYNTKANWKKYTIEGEGGPYTVTVQAEDPTMGDVSIVVN